MTGVGHRSQPYADAMDRAQVAHRVELTQVYACRLWSRVIQPAPQSCCCTPGLSHLGSFDRLGPLLPLSLHVLAMDQHGHGQAAASDDGYDVESLGADVEAFMDALDLSVAVLVGSSSGGYVAQQVAVRSPGRVAGLVLIGSPPTLQGRPAFADEIEGLSDPIDPSWVRAFLETFPLFHDVPDWFLRDRVRESARIPARPHLRGRRPLGPLGRARARCRRHRGLRPGHHRLTPTTILLCEGQQGAVGSTWQSSRGSRPCGHVDHGPNGPPAGNGTGRGPLVAMRLGVVRATMGVLPGGWPESVVTIRCRGRALGLRLRWHVARLPP